MWGRRSSAESAAGARSTRGRKRPIRIASVEEIEKELIAARKHEDQYVAVGEPDYPPALQEIELGAAHSRASGARGDVAQGGGRNRRLPQRFRRRTDFRRAAGARSGTSRYVIVSGLARGIDQRAHMASLETGAIGVLAGGHGKPYPSEAVPLMERMVEAGAVLSEMPVEWEPRGRLHVATASSRGSPWAS